MSDVRTVTWVDVKLAEHEGRLLVDVPVARLEFTYVLRGERLEIDEYASPMLPPGATLFGRHQDGKRWFFELPGEWRERGARVLEQIVVGLGLSTK